MKAQIAGIVIILAAVLFLTGCESTQAPVEKGAEPASESPSGLLSVRLTGEQTAAIGVRVEPAVAEDVPLKVVVPGRVVTRAGGEATVSAPFAGRLILPSSHVLRTGDFVRKGEVIAEVEQPFSAPDRLQFKAAALQLQSAVEEARQEVAFRESEAERCRQLYQGGAIALKQLQAAEVALEQAKTKLEGAQRAREEYQAAEADNSSRRREVIRAPISGVIISAGLVAGEQADPAANLLTIADLTVVWVKAAVHETDLPAVSKSLRAEVTTRGEPRRIRQAKLVTVGDVIDSASRTADVLFSVANPDRSLKIGMYADVAIVTQEVTHGCPVPTPAVLYDGADSFVYVEVAPGVFERRIVKTRGDGDRAIITDGIRPGEKIATAGAQFINSEALKHTIHTEDEGDED